MPGSVQHVEQKAVQNRPLAAGAVDHGFGWATTPQTKRTHTNKINSAGRALTELSAFSLPDSPGAPGSMCAEKPVDQVSPQISPCMRKKGSASKKPTGRDVNASPFLFLSLSLGCKKPKGEEEINQSSIESGAKHAIQPSVDFNTGSFGSAQRRPEPVRLSRRS